MHFMIAQLTVHNFLLVEHAELSIDSRFIAVTGETGSGKSIFLESLYFIFGAKADADIIRLNCKEASVELTINLSKNKKLMEWCTIQEIPLDDGPFLIVWRSISNDGKSRAKLNGISVATAMLRQISELCLEFHRHTDHVLLFKPIYQLEMIDRVSDLSKPLQKYRVLFEAWQIAKQKHDKLVEQKGNQDDLIEMLTKKVYDLTEAHLELDKEALEKESFMLSEHQDGAVCLNEVHERLNQSESGILANLKKLQDILLKSSFIKNQTTYANEFQKIFQFFNELSSDVELAMNQAKFDPHRLEFIDVTLKKTRALEMKYHLDQEGLKKLLDQCNNELIQLRNIDEEIENYKKSMHNVFGECNLLSREISKIRQQSAKKMKSNVTEMLRRLGMEHATFEIQFNDVELSATGRDAIQFLISTNVGYPLQPLEDVSSSGELSRIMLSLKTILAEVLDNHLLVFDEIDANIGGQTAVLVGTYLKKLAEHYQIVCVTHLAPIASKADQHLAIRKVIKQDETVSVIEVLSKADRVKELERMLGGYNSQSVRQHAKELLSS